MTDLDERLRELRADLEWPQTPEVTVPAGTPARSRRRPRRIVALAAGLTLATAGVGGAAVLLSLDGATVERRDAPPPVASPAGRLFLGRPITLAQAPFRPLLPARAGAPAAVHLRDGIEVALSYPPGPGRPRAGTTGLGLLVTQFEGRLHTDYVGQVAYQGTTVDPLRVDGRRALWIEGAAHFFFYRPPGGELSERDLRLAANVLLIERDGLLVRLEGEFDRTEALALARSLR